MNKFNRILLDPLPADGGAFNPAILPEDLRGEASLAQIKTIPDLARSYVNAQRLVGADKVVLPGKNATPEQMAEFYTKLGRPAEADKYSHAPDLKLPEGLNIKPEALAEVKKQFHTLGLSKSQGDALLTYYLGQVSKDHTEANASTVDAQAKAVSALREEWGDNYDKHMDIAKSTIRKFATPEAVQELETSGLGNNPQLIRMLHKMGVAMLEDHAGGDDNSLPVGSAAAALGEINRLKVDTEFQKALQNNGAGHKEAVDRWTRLHQTAYPGKSE